MTYTKFRWSRPLLNAHHLHPIPFPRGLERGPARGQVHKPQCGWPMWEGRTTLDRQGYTNTHPIWYLLLSPSSDISQTGFLIREMQNLIITDSKMAALPLPLPSPPFTLPRRPANQCTPRHVLIDCRDMVNSWC